MKPSILTNFNNDVKFHNYTLWSINDIGNHLFPCWISNHNIDNKNMVLINHVEIGS
jgi:hypothetical protein